jgi:ribonuclease HII
LLRIEREHWDRNLGRLAGVDEAGRGPLAGPVVAAAVVFDRSFVEAEEHGLLNGLTDSKKLSASRRESFFFELLDNSPFVETGVGVSEVAEIDSVNILRATHLAMSRAVANLAPLPDHVLVDGLAVEGLPCPSTAIVAGDSKSLSIAAASVVAKVVRDDLMKKLDVLYPEYGFAGHKGYGSKAHIQALFEHGPTPVHRRSFRPVREAREIRRRQEDESSAGGEAQ